MSAPDGRPKWNERTTVAAFTVSPANFNLINAHVNGYQNAENQKILI